jgi:hypothetical protein
MSAFELNQAQFCETINPLFSNMSILATLTLAQTSSDVETFAVKVDGEGNLQFYNRSGASDVANPITIAPNGEVTIPSLSVPGADVLSVTSGTGSGINAVGTTNVNLTSALIAGDGITLTPSTSDTGLVIASSGISGVATVDDGGNGCGITIGGTTADPTVSTNLVAGSGIVLTPSTSDTGIVISATGGGGGGGVNSVADGGDGCGITIGGTAADPTVETNLVAGNHIVLTPNVGDTGLQIGTDGKVPVVLVQYLPTIGSGLVNGGYQTISGTSSQYFTLTAGLWAIDLSGSFLWNNSTSCFALQINLQQQTSNSIVTAWTFPAWNASYALNVGGTNFVYTPTTIVVGLFIGWPMGDAYCNGVSTLNVRCCFLGNTQDPLSTGTPYA